MKKRNIAYFTAGALIFGCVGVFAGQYTATNNAFPIQLNGNNVSMEGYNIDGSTYFKLRDISSVVGGFDVDFQNSTIQLSKDGYVYDNSVAQKDYSKYIGTWTDGDLWGLTVSSIDSNGMNVSIYRLRGKDITYEVNSTSFIDENTIVAQGRFGFLPYGNGLQDTTFTFKLSGNNIIFTQKDDDPVTMYKE